jgi:hypothetical protein
MRTDAVLFVASERLYRNTKRASLLFEAGQPAVRAGAASPLRHGRFAGQCRRGAPGASASNLLARRLERAGSVLLAPVSKVVTTVLLQSAAAGALATLRALDPGTPSGAFVGPAGFGQLRGRPELRKHLRLREESGDGRAAVGAHRADARRAAARLTVVDAALDGLWAGLGWAATFGCTAEEDVSRSRYQRTVCSTASVRGVARRPSSVSAREASTMHGSSNS